MIAREESAYPAHGSRGLDRTDTFVGRLSFRHNAGPLEHTNFLLMVEPESVTLIYDDGREHVATDPATVAFFSAGLVPSLEAVERA